MTNEQRKILPLRLAIFIWERFPPFAHIPLIFFFFLANALVSLLALNADITIANTMTALFTTRSVLAAITTLFFFLHLRIFDEVKDLETDKIVHPERPLVRGLLTSTEAKVTAFVLIGIEIALAAFTSFPALRILIAACAFSFLMYKEFYMKTWFEGKMVLYALFHSPVTIFLALFIFSAVTGVCYQSVPFPVILLALLNWCLSSLFEFSRKTFATEEERAERESYSKKFGVQGGAAVSFALALFAGGAAWWIGHATALPLWYSIAVIVLVALAFFATLFLAFTNTVTSGKIFRGVMSLTLLALYILVSLGVLWKASLL